MEYTKENLVKIITEYNKEELAYILKAYEFAKLVHANQYRASGESYIVHPLAVAIKLAEVKADKNTICAALLHDVIEDTPCSYLDLVNYFNKNIADLVYGVTKVSEITSIDRDEASRLTTKKLILSVTTDVRILIIKLFDRVHNMETLDFLKAEKQKRIALQTMEFYAPIAYYLGIYSVKRKLEDLSFKYLNENKYNEVSSKIIEFSNDKDELHSMIINKINLEIMTSCGVSFDIDLRTKNIYRTFLKLMDGYSYNNMIDLFSYKILVNSEPDCYRVLSNISEIHDSEKLKIKDYVIQEKINNYRAIHAIVKYYGLDSQLKILTNEMDFFNAYGLVGCWQFLKGLAPEKMMSEVQNSIFYKTVLHLEKNADLDNKNFVAEVRRRLFLDNDIHKL